MGKRDAGSILLAIRSNKRLFPTGNRRLLRNSAANPSSRTYLRYIVIEEKS
jgi:hypothetical protein